METTRSYKTFPFGLSHLLVPESSRRAALSAIALHSPCSKIAILVQRFLWTIASGFGPKAIPGRRSPWRPPLDRALWAELCERWRVDLGHFDDHAVYQRMQTDRPGIALLLLQRGRSVAFVKLREAADALDREAEALALVSRFGSESFRVAKALGRGEFEGLHYLAIEPLRSKLHRPPENPPLAQVTAEVSSALMSLARPAGIPVHWRPMHGDLTPWNLREFGDGDRVLVDWEDVGFGPPDADDVLYRATATALLGAPLCAASPEQNEAIGLWLRRFEHRPHRANRDRRLALRVARVLRDMRPRASAA